MRVVRFAVILFSLSIIPAASFAATFVVNSTADAVDAAPGNAACATATATCTLRAAVMEANALAGADTITLPAGTYTLTIAGINEDGGATGDLDVTDALTVNGAAGAVIDANAIDRAIDLGPGAYTFTLNDVTVTGGLVTPLDFDHAGGGLGLHQFLGTAPAVVINGSAFTNNTAETGGGVSINVSGPGGNLTVTNSSFDGNTTTSSDGAGIFYDTTTGSLSIADSTFGTSAGNIAQGDGGAVEYVMRNDPSVRQYDILRSTFLNNQALGEGGALYYCCGTFNATLVESTVANNTSADGGGGIYTCCGGTDELTIVNSTISGNVTTAPAGDGGGIDLEGDVTLLNTTIAFNDSQNGGGVSLDGGTLTTRNALIGSNTTTDCAGQVGFSTTSQGGNLDSDGTCAPGFDAAGDMSDALPMLGPLANNGGPTMTHALLPGSDAIDNAVAGAPATDQRGVARPIGAASDIGSFEAAATALTPTTTTLTSSVNPSTAGQSVTFTATVSGAGGPPTGTVTFRDGATVLGTVALNGAGTAAFTTAGLSVGSHSITATYNGDATFATSVSAPLVQVVAAAGATAAVPALDPRALAILAVLLAAMAMFAMRMK